MLEMIRKIESGISAQDMVDLIVSDVAEFACDVEPADDMTVVVLRYSG